MFNYDLESFSTDQFVPFTVGLKKVSKVSSKNYRDKTDREIEKCKIDCGVFNGTNSINEMLHCVFEFKGEAKTVTSLLNTIFTFSSPWIKIWYVSFFKQ